MLGLLLTAQSLSYIILCCFVYMYNNIVISLKENEIKVDGIEIVHGLERKKKRKNVCNSTGIICQSINVISEEHWTKLTSPLGICICSQT